MPRVLIINMPFANLRWPNIGPSLLKAALLRRGIGCDIAYLNFDFAERVGIEHYYWIADHFAFVLGGERLFARQYFDAELPDDEAYFRAVLLHTDPKLTDQDRADYDGTQPHIEPFLDQAMASVDWSQYAVVGFATSFQQTMASMCLARRVKEQRPDIQIAFGGAACEGRMGIELLRQFEPVDYVFLGEADLNFAPLVERILAGGPVTLPPGVVGRESLVDGLEPACCEIPSACDSEHFMVQDMDVLPYPDFDDYFARLLASPLRDQIDELLFFETSRGCWWGQKHHCAFCGLNGSTLSYRSKSPKRAVAELQFLVERYDTHRACSADNILDFEYFKTFLPQLQEANLDLSFVYEMKTNLSRQQVQTLLDAGMGAAQLGIETFITPVLKLIGKGATAIHNLQALKWFSEPGIEVKWNVLYGFPKENPKDYAAMADLIPSLYHLAPPLAAGRVRMDRFSPYFEDPPTHGMVNPRANRAFSYVYPFPQVVLDQLAYYYEYDYADGRNPLDYTAPVLQEIEKWQSLKGTVTLQQYDRPDGVLILTDTRPFASMLQNRLTGLERSVYLFCDSGRGFNKILDHAQQYADGEAVDETRLRVLLDRWIADRIMVRLDNRYLSLALRAPSDVAPAA